MFNKLMDFFSGGTSLEVDKNGTPTSKDLQVATAVLLLEMAGADEDFAPEEVQSCFRSMEKQFNISDSETLAIMELAQKSREDQGKVDSFVAAINENFSDKQRQLILAMIWKVVIADQLVERYEQKLAEQFRARLKLTEQQSEEAKSLALQGHV